MGQSASWTISTARIDELKKIIGSNNFELYYDLDKVPYVWWIIVSNINILVVKMDDYCQAFHQNPAINPRTGGRLIFGKGPYNRYVEECGPPSSLKIDANISKSFALTDVGVNSNKVAIDANISKSKAFTDVVPPKLQIVSTAVPHSVLSEAPSPNISGVVCILINNKKLDRYIHPYNPAPMLEKLRTMGYTESQLSIFDQRVTRNCANVVSIALYLQFKTKYEIAQIYDRYLMSIQRTIKNVAKNLPTWIVRLYLDTTVYDLLDHDAIHNLPNYADYIETGSEHEAVMAKALIQAQEAVQFMVNADNVEVYTYSCPNIESNLVESKGPSLVDMAKIRSYRFLPLSDPEVNVCAVREADGIVTNLDCMNLRNFNETGDRLFYLLYLQHRRLTKPRSEGQLIKEPNSSYSLWLNVYREIFMADYFRNNFLLQDLLAGTFTSKLRLKRDVYLEKSAEVESNINTVGRGFNILKTGFDEILLLTIFRDFICLPRGHPYDYYDTFINQMFYADNLRSIDLSDTQDLEHILDKFEMEGFKPDRDRARGYYDCFMSQTPQKIWNDDDDDDDEYEDEELAARYWVYFMDSIINTIQSDEIIDVKSAITLYNGFEANIVLAHYINVPYDSKFDVCYDL